MQEANFRRDSLNLSQPQIGVCLGPALHPSSARLFRLFWGLRVAFCPAFAVVLSLPLWRLRVLLLLVRTRSARLWVLPQLPAGAAALWVLLQHWEAEHGLCHSLLPVQGGSAPLWVLLQRREAEHMPCHSLLPDLEQRIRNRRFPGASWGSHEALRRMKLCWLLLPSSPFRAGAELSTPPGFS